MMANTEFSPMLRQLSHSDKLLMLNFLVAELPRESGIEPMSIHNDDYKRGLHDSFEAATSLAKALQEKQEFAHS